ncbi:MAG: hypothetical protein DRO00_08705 [Thermoproteota archaeon]|nr:MAG: hypothetical protein DRO00_08705 [Candidatus Korarchaeota archaeon]
MRSFWAEKALPFMLIVLGVILVISSVLFPSIDSVEIDVSNLLPKEIEVPIASYSFNITVDNPLVGKVVIPVEIGGSKLTVKLSEIIEGQKIEISLASLAWLSHILIALRIFLALLGTTLIVSGLAIRSILG